MLSEETGGTTMGLVQDGVLGLYLLSQTDQFFDRSRFYEMLQFDDQLPHPAVFTPGGVRLWTGKQLISMRVPSEVSMHAYCGGESFLVHKGELLHGTVTKKAVGPGCGGLIHATCQQIDENAGGRLMTSLQQLASLFLKQHGFSIGIDDCIASAGVRADCIRVIEETTASTPKGDENQILGHMNALLPALGPLVMQQQTNLTTIVRSGSKGSSINVAQICACVGQVQVGGVRPHGDFPLPGTHGHISRGFCPRSLSDGLSASEMFSHMAGTREGACRPARSVVSCVGLISRAPHHRSCGHCHQNSRNRVHYAALDKNIGRSARCVGRYGPWQQ